MPNMSQTLSRYFSRDTMPAGGVTLTIRTVLEEGMKRGEKDVKDYVVYGAEDPRGVVLNKTRKKTLIAFFGENSEDWIGKQVHVFVDPLAGGAKGAGLAFRKV